MSSIDGIRYCIESFNIDCHRITHVDLSDNKLQKVFDVDALMSILSNLEYINVLNNNIAAFYALKRHPSIKRRECDEELFKIQLLFSGITQIFPNIGSIIFITDGI